MPSDPQAPGLSRRKVVAAGAALAVELPLAVRTLAGAADAAPVAPAVTTTPAAQVAPPLPSQAPAASSRTGEAYRVRVAAAAAQRDQPWPATTANGDETELPRYIACYSKALPHDRRGEVDPGAYQLLLRALRSGKPRDFELIPVGVGGRVKLANPQSALAFNLVGPDSSVVACPPAPRFASAEQAAEMAELYWQALARDVPFADYESSPLIAEAAADLGRFSDLRAPRQGGKVTPRTIFRGAAEGSLAGPYISQFLYRDIFFTPIRVQQRIRTAVADRDYLGHYEEWLDNQNGALAGVNTFNPDPAYVRTGRDLGEYVHRDFTYQAGMGASLILLKMGAPPNAGNPYKHSRTQSGFTTFGAPYLLFLLATVSQAALTACWYQKWMVHRRLRPEEMGGRVANHLARRARYPLHPSLLDSRALATTLSRHSSALLSGAYPEGAPTHPSYPAGHPVLSAAGATVLKAFFDEKYVLPQPVEPSADGQALQPYGGPPLTVGGELDKLAVNIGMGRNFAGIHWRSDLAEGLRLGEEVAISVLREIKLTGNELLAGFTFHRLDGTPVTV
jgi:hypothetical protein